MIHCSVVETTPCFDFGVRKLQENPHDADAPVRCTRVRIPPCMKISSVMAQGWLEVYRTTLCLAHTVV